jgi:hypothetical protein
MTPPGRNHVRLAVHGIAIHYSCASPVRPEAVADDAMPDPVTYRVGQIWERDGIQRRILRLFLKQVSVDSVVHGQSYRIDWIRSGARYPTYARSTSWELWSQHATLAGFSP